MTDPLPDPEMLAQIPVVSAAWKFLLPAFRDHDLRAAWPSASPTMRLCWAQWWVSGNRTAMESNGLDVTVLANELAGEAPEHQLWEHFERVALRDFTGLLGDQLDNDRWGIGTGVRTIAPDVELLYLHRIDGPGGLIWQPDEQRQVLPVVMELIGGSDWKVLNIGSESIPKPGYPPTL